MDWLNLRELLGCVLLEQALGIPYAQLFRIELATNPQLVAKINRYRDKFRSDPLKETEFDSYASKAGRLATVLAVACVYVSLDFLLNVF